MFAIVNREIVHNVIYDKIKNSWEIIEANKRSISLLDLVSSRVDFIIKEISNCMVDDVGQKRKQEDCSCILQIKSKTTQD